MFKVQGADTRKLAWKEQTVNAVPGEFAVERPVRLSNPSAGITGSVRHAGGAVPVGVADVINGDTSQDDAVGAGPLVTEITLTSSGSDTDSTKAAGAGADDSSYGANAWTNPGNVLAADDTYATLAAAGLSHYLKATSFAFAVTGTILGIEAWVERSKAVAAADTGVVAPGTGATDPSVGANAWSTPGNILTSNNSHATCALSGDTNALKATNFGFTIPPTATILGVLAAIERKAATAGGPITSYSVAGTYSYVVPAGVTSLDFTLNGSGGAAGTSSGGTAGGVGGAGGKVVATIAVTPAETLTIVVGGVGARASVYRGATPLLIAGAGGEGGDAYPGNAGGAGGAGGGTTGGTGATGGGTHAPGTGGVGGSQVGIGADGASPGSHSVEGGIAGAGYFAGGKGGWGGGWTEGEPEEGNSGADGGGGGGGGSSYVVGTATGVTNTQGGGAAAAVAGDLTITLASVLDKRVSLINAAGGFGATNKADLATYWPTVDTVAVYGGAGDLWGETLTPAIVNDVDFGVMLQATIVLADQASVDQSTLRVYYEDGDVVDSQVRLVVNGLVVGTNHADIATQWPAADAVKVYGGPTDMWGLTTADLTAALVNTTATFGVVVAANKGSAAGSARIDQVRMKVYTRAAASSPPTKIWDDGADSSSTRHRYIYIGSGSRIHVVDPTTDLEVEATLFGSGGVDGWDAARWAGRWWASPRGGAADFVQEVKVPYDGVTATNYDPCDFTATALASGPNALYRAYVSGSNKALVKKTTETTQPVAAAVVLTLTGQPLDTETVVLGSKTYTFQTVLTNVDGHVLIGGTTALSLTNLINAINLNAGVVGTDYATLMTVHPTVTAAQGTGTTATITARETGTTGNSIASTETLTNGSFAAVTLLLGADTITLNANWSPSSGEQMGDPGIGIIRLAVVGDRFVAGKEDGLVEFDTDYAPRFYLDWMRAFQWTLQCNGILPLGISGDMLVTFRRGLWILPRNISIGVEQLPNNNSGKVGRYTDVAFDGNWIYAGLQNPNTGKAYLIKMRFRHVQGAPGLFEHHPVYERAASQFQAFWMWPGATVNGVVYGPRLYFAISAQKIGYIRLGETQPDQFDPNSRFTSEWSVEWPLDDFGAPQTQKTPYRVEFTAAGVEGSDGIKWEVRADADDEWSELTADGTRDGQSMVVSNTYHRRHGPKDGSLLGRRWSVKVSGRGGLPTQQQRVVGAPIFTILEQPEQVREIKTTLQLEAYEGNDDDAAVQFSKLDDAAGGQMLEMECTYDEAEGHDVAYRFTGYLDVQRDATVSSADVPGVYLASATIRTMGFFDPGDERDEEAGAD